MKRITTLFALLAVSAALGVADATAGAYRPGAAELDAYRPGAANPGLILPMPRIRW